jgi:hypothetical protein
MGVDYKRSVWTSAHCLTNYMKCKSFDWLVINTINIQYHSEEVGYVQFCFKVAVLLFIGSTV